MHFWWGSRRVAADRRRDAAAVDAPPERRAVDEVTAPDDEPLTFKPLVLRVLGCVELELRQGATTRDITCLLTPKQQELLVCLAMGLESGVRRETLNQAVWPASPQSRPYNSLHNALSLLRRALTDATDGAVRDLVVRTGSSYRLSHHVVDVDYWQLRSALDSNSSTADGRLGPLESVAALCRGDLAKNLTSLWIEMPREAVRRETLDALGVLVEQGPVNALAQAVRVLEQIRQADLYNESLYRDIMRAQLRLGQVEAARRTLALLTNALEDLGQRPANETCYLVSFAQLRAGAYGEQAASSAQKDGRHDIACSP